jgi:broad specificity phosphatase PhoE
MSVLAIRHGQASFGAENYDQLSERGARQSERLGTWLAQRMPRPQRVLIGAMHRHRQTLEAILSGAELRADSLVPVEVDARLNEFDHRAVVESFVRTNPGHPCANAMQTGAAIQPRAVFQLLLDALQAWARDALTDTPESWRDFATRTHAVANELARDPGCDAWVITSGGVLSQWAQQALDVPSVRSVELNLSIRNSAVCEFHPLGQRLRLGSWNSLPHLPIDDGLWTHF